MTCNIIEKRPFLYTLWVFFKAKKKKASYKVNKQDKLVACKETQIELDTDFSETQIIRRCWNKFYRTLRKSYCETSIFSQPIYHMCEGNREIF